MNYTLQVYELNDDNIYSMSYSSFGSYEELTVSIRKTFEFDTKIENNLFIVTDHSDDMNFGEEFNLTDFNKDTIIKIIRFCIQNNLSLNSSFSWFIFDEKWKFEENQATKIN